jgi:hypothetical protein
MGIFTTARLAGLVEDESQEPGSEWRAWTRSSVRSGKASDDLGSRCICTVRWSSLCRANDTILLGLGCCLPGGQSLTCPGPVALLWSARFVPVPVSFPLLFVSVYDLRSVLVVLMLMDGHLLSFLLILVLLAILLLLSEVGLVG